MAIRITDEQGLADIQSGNEYELGCDIALTATWSSLEEKKSVTIYGNGHKISGLSQPLFGNLAHSKISHIRLECDLHETSSRNLGALCRYGLQLTLSGCTVAGSVSGAKYVGGLAGDLSQSSVTDCTNLAPISGEDYVGGLIGNTSHSSVKGCTNNSPIRPIGRGMYAGGIIGYAMDQSFISDNVNEGSIMEFKFHGCGGICGGLRESRVFQGNINKGIINGARYVGGLVGIAEECCIMYNENLMPVNAIQKNAGGIVGYAYSAPLLVHSNINAGALDSDGENAGGIVGCAGDGVVITDNTVSCPSIRGSSHVARVLGMAEGKVHLKNSRVFGNCMLKGGVHSKGIYNDQIVFPDDPNLGEGKLMGASYVPPDGFKPSGLRMHLEPVEKAEEPQTEEDKERGAIAAGVKVLSGSFTQITTALSLGVTALARVFQADAEFIKPLLRKEKENIRTLRLLNTSLAAYIEFMDRMEAIADAETPTAAEQVEVDENGVPQLTSHIRRVVLHMVSEVTQQPLANTRVTLRKNGADMTFVSDTEGRIVLERLPEGEFEVSEQEAPLGYMKDSAVHHLKASADGTVAWDGRLGLRWNDEIMVTVPHARDDSWLFMTGENWHARPEVFKANVPVFEAPPEIEAAAESVFSPARRGPFVSLEELLPDKEARDIAKTALDKMLKRDQPEPDSTEDNMNKEAQPELAMATAEQTADTDKGAED